MEPQHKSRGVTLMENYDRNAFILVVIFLVLITWAFTR